MNYKKILAILLAIVMFQTSVTHVAAFDAENRPNDTPEIEAIADMRDWHINEDGIAETQDYFFLPDTDLMPSYIDEIEYLDEAIDDYDFFDWDSLIEEKENRENNISTAAITKANESEPNNTYSQANIYQLNSQLSGVIGSTGDIDYFKVDFIRDGKAKFNLSNIPQNCNYDMKIYSQPKSGGSLTLLKTLASTRGDEVLDNYVIDSTKWYYIQIYSSKGYDTSRKYILQVSLTPSDDSYEPNNSFKDAHKISSGAYVPATIHKSTDVDFYKVTLNYGVLTAALAGIPSGCDYRMAIYDQYEKIIAETPESGSSDKILSIPVSGGTYYIKIYSKSGYNINTNYRLGLSFRDAQTTVKGTISPGIKTAGNKGLSSTPINNLPIQLVYTKKNNATQYVLATTKTDSSGAFTTSIRLPADVDKLFVKTYPDSSSVAVRLLDDSTYTTLFQIPYNSATVTLSVTGQTAVTSQFQTTMSLWRFANDGLSACKWNGNPQTPKLIVRCTYNKTAGTQANKDHIQINGSPASQDYYDWDVFLHELGHWVMGNNGGFPIGSGLTHVWNKPSNEGTAYAEGWAHYFSAAMRNNSLVLDYNSSGGSFGGNLSTGEVKEGTGSSFHKPQTYEPYSDNAKMEINVGASLWNLSSVNSKTYSSMESVMKKHHNNWKSFFLSYISSLSSNNKELAWNTCEKFHVAYDLEPPVVSLSINGLNATMTATDNIAVKSYDWYVDGIKQASGTGSSGSLNLGSLGLTSGSHTLQCRVYDPEGQATGKRPRVQRYGSAEKTFSISKGVNTTISMNYDIFDIPHNMCSLMDSSVSIEPGSSYSTSVILPDKMDLYIFSQASGAIKEYTIISPDGDVFDRINYIAPDDPFVIKSAIPGTWEVIANSYSIEEIKALSVDVNEIEDSTTALDEIPPVLLNLNLAMRPSKVEVLNDFEISNNPYILSTFNNDETIIFYNSNGRLDDRMPLPDGEYHLKLVRFVHGLESEATDLSLLIDTTAPTISCLEIPDETIQDRFVLTMEFSENIAQMTINEEPIDLGYCNTPFYTSFELLDIGENRFDIEVTDYAGNVTRQSIFVERVPYNITDKI